MANEPKVSDADDSAAGQNHDTEDIQKLRAELTRAQQEKAKLKQTLDELQPYVTYGEPEPEPEPPPAVPARTPDEVDRLEAAFKRTQEMVGDMATSYFYKANPDLKEHEDWVLAAYNRLDRNRPAVERLDEAAEKVRERIRKIEEVAMEKVKAEKDTKKKAAAATAGVVEAGSTAPEALEADEPWDLQSYSAQRLKQQRELLS
jgi:predicted  nucleic acid-binding Zn-ribbon protein